MMLQQLGAAMLLNSARSCRALSQTSTTGRRTLLAKSSSKELLLLTSLKLIATSGVAATTLRRLYIQFKQKTQAACQHNKEALPTQIVKLVPQQEAWIVERFGKFQRILQPGLAILLPVVDRISYVHSLKEIALEIPSQSAITQDNVTLQLDGVLYLRVMDPYKASYGVEDPEYAVSQLAQTTMRSEIGKLSLDTIFRERTALNEAIVESINQAANVWGIACLRYEIRDIQLPDRVVEAMQMQVAAERRKRAAVLESEGSRESAINVAEGQKRSQILASEAMKMEKINEAEGEAAAILARAGATAEGIRKIAEAMQAQGGHDAVTLNIAQQYVEAFGKLAQEGTTMLLPANAADPGAMIAQALAIYKNIGSAHHQPPALPTPPHSPQTEREADPAH